ncbi:cytochrome b/b6 domain-containing protein [Thalassobacter stenotrophicus]|uniref:cytochrome b/b6 domain-containing protein n=1 Tax=Thalassobacter stenotrophicus TaxID=266809 RepID=UPI0022A9B145|nr:cytochrome b/b6 domain-containing protein [Thalassobacter stenotrophicus]UYP68940.1 cytochrome b/b6 domain-containing protein [Thalassobacter stenotrophicus]
MPAANTRQHYGSVTKTFHWLTALLILTVIPLGIVAQRWSFDTSDALAIKATLFSIHKTVGLTLFFVALARIAWAVTQAKPGPLHPDRKLETFAAETVHWALYASLVVVPLTGWIHHAATEGFAPIWWPFGQKLPFVPKDVELAHTFASLHIIFERVLIISLGLHIAGALKHAWIDRDATLARMLPGTNPKVPNYDHTTTASPAIAAFAAYGLALLVGAGLGMFAHQEGPATPQLEAVASDWQVTDGTLAITVTQLGAPVTGQFADWTAAITFDETVTDGVAGQVDVTISVPSLSLGSVTTQALGAEFFNASDFATATFSAPIRVTDGAYLADGTVTIRGITVPATLPFTLALQDGIATVEARTQLSRLSFGMGETAYPDESSVGFAVDVAISLTASRDTATPIVN